MTGNNGKARLLVVDDEAAFGKLVGQVAAELGYDVEVLSSAAALLERYADFAPDVIVLDIVMPEMDGIEAINWLADQGCAARLVLVTGYNPDYARLAEAIAETCRMEVTRLTKPVRVAELRTALSPPPPSA